MSRGAGALALAVLLGACGGGADTQGVGPTTTPSPTVLAELPPNNVPGIERIYGEGLESLGVRLVRAALVDRTDGGFDYDAQGSHLALYVEPTGASSIRDYVRRIVPVTELFASTVFAYWPGLESFDVCQEPSPNVDDSTAPPPITQVTLWREEAGTIDWGTFDLVDLLALSRQKHPQEDRPRALVVAADQIERFPGYRDAMRAAEATAGDAAA